MRLPLALGRFLGYNTRMKHFLRDEQNKICLLTGASSGIGKELARLLIAQGFTVVGVARNEEKLAAAREELGSAFIPFSGDVSKKETWERVDEDA